MIPEGWELRQLYDLSSKISDGLHSTPNYVESSDYFFINGNNLKNGHIVIGKTTKCVSKEEAKKHKKELSDRTILMSINGTIGSLAYYQGENVILGKSAAYINLKDSVNKDFIYYFLSTSKTQQLFESELTGTTIRNLSLRSIKSIKVLLPPLPEQKKIAQILTTWDKAIETVEKLIANSQQKKKALMQQLLTGKKRFPEFDGEWKEAPLKQLCIITKGKQLNKSTLSKQGLYPVINGGIKPSGYTDKFNCIKGTITISEGGNSCGYVGLIRQDFWCGGHCYTVSPKTIENMYLHHYLKFNEPKIMRLRVGSGLPNIQKKAIESVKVRYPSANEQQKISSVLSSADQEIETWQQELAHLQQEKKALMQQLLTGKRRVKVAVSATEALQLGGSHEV